MATEVEEGVVDCSGLVVESSQSQYLLPFVRSPDKRSRRTGDNRSEHFKRPPPLEHFRESALLTPKELAEHFATVPTSQSEEEELLKDVTLALPKLGSAEG